MLFITVLLAIRTGAVDITYRDIFISLARALGFHFLDKVETIQQGVFMQIRLPRVLLCVIVGAGLSVSGALMQALFRNPIVEPGLIGTSSGAAFGAALVFVAGRDFLSQYSQILGIMALPLSAFVFSLLPPCLCTSFRLLSGRLPFLL